MSKQLPDGVTGSIKVNHGGIILDHRKAIIFTEEIHFIKPKRVRIPLSMHIGAPCKPVVKVRDYVQRGQLIADSDEFISSPIHASISGTIKSVQIDDQFIEIESDGEMTPYENISIPIIKSKDDFLKEVRKSGLVGLGGAGFPASVKLSIQDGEVDTLIANGAECEPYLTSDDYTMNYRQDDILDGMVETMKWLKIPNGIFAIENNKLNTVKSLNDKIKSDPEKYKNITIVVMDSVYPKGMEKITIYNATGRVVPMGKLPKDVGCIVQNVNTLAELGKYLRTGMPLVDRIVTIDGEAIKETQNLIIPIGTIIEEVFDYTGLNAEPQLVMMGGPMMGVPLSSTQSPIIKQNNAILAMLDGEFQLADETNCIRCSRCLDVCPMSLQPTTIVKAVQTNNFEKAQDYDISNCMECGSCGYACPAKIPLVHYIRHGKREVRKLRNQ